MCVVQRVVVMIIVVYEIFIQIIVMQVRCINMNGMVCSQLMCLGLLVVCFVVLLVLIQCVRVCSRCQCWWGRGVIEVMVDFGGCCVFFYVVVCVMDVVGCGKFWFYLGIMLQCLISGCVQVCCYLLVDCLVIGELKCIVICGQLSWVLCRLLVSWNFSRWWLVLVQISDRCGVMLLYQVFRLILMVWVLMFCQ